MQARGERQSQRDQQTPGKLQNQYVSPSGATLLLWYHPAGALTINGHFPGVRWRFTPYALS